MAALLQTVAAVVLLFSVVPILFRKLDSALVGVIIAVAAASVVSLTEAAAILFL